MLKFNFTYLVSISLTVLTIFLQACSGSSTSEVTDTNTVESKRNLPTEASDYLSEIRAFSDSIDDESLGFFKNHLLKYATVVETWYLSNGDKTDEHWSFKIIMDDQLDNFRSMKAFYEDLHHTENDSQQKALDYFKKKFSYWEPVYDKLKVENSNLISDISNAKSRFAMYQATDRYKEFKKVKRGK